VTLFTTPDWRELSPFPTRRIAARVPLLRERMFLARTLAPGTMRLDRHPEFVAYLKRLPRTEIALHGLHHVHRGLRIPVEFQGQSADECESMLGEAIAIFGAAGLRRPRGITPPGWDVPPALAAALVKLRLAYVASARDIVTPVSAAASTNMSGIRGVSLIRPDLIEGSKLVHITTNFQATSPVDRAFDIIELGGLLAIKAHIVKTAYGYVASDGLDQLYRNYLDVLFTQLGQRYGGGLWWTTMSEVASHVTPAEDATTR
jgi:hypothetical protein